MTRRRLVFAAIAPLLLVAGVTTATTASAAKPLCHGKTATIVGTSGDDVIKGTSGADVVVSRGGRDIINTYGGHDLVCSGDKKDIVDLGPGNDTMYGGGGADHLIGKGGNDRLHGQSGRDSFIGGAGDDTMYGGTGGDFFNTVSPSHDPSRGNDRYIAGDTRHNFQNLDWVYYYGAKSGVVVDLRAGTATGSTIGTDSLDGIDSVYGSTYADRISGSAGDNQLVGEAGDDVLRGRAGDDRLEADAGDDKLDGGAGDADILDAGDGNDGCSGESQTGCEYAWPA